MSGGMGPVSLNMTDPLGFPLTGVVSLPIDYMYA